MADYLQLYTFHNTEMTDLPLLQQQILGHLCWNVDWSKAYRLQAATE